MTAFFTILALAGYFGFLIDWKELRDVLKAGAWATFAFYCLIGICIFAATAAAPHVAGAAPMHH